MNKPTVSVIMNCYNSKTHLREALDSVFAQTYHDWELLFWDNGSTDGSGEVAQSYGERVRYFHTEETVSLGAARNKAIAESKGALLAFLDCDDLWLPSKLEKQVALFASNPKLGLACTDTEMFNSHGVLSRQFDAAQPSRGHVFRELIQWQWISMSSAMIRRSALDSLDHWFDPALHVCEEADVFYRIAKDWELDYVNEPLTRWRVHDNNTTFHKFGLFADETLLMLEKHRRIYPRYDQEYGDLVALLTRRAAYQKAISVWRDGNGSRARSLICPYMQSGKVRLLWLATWLPGRYFDLLARYYFMLPAFLRR